MQQRNETTGKILRFFTSLACILFGMCIILNMDNIKTALVEDVIPYVHSHMSNENIEVAKINTKFSAILNEQSEIVDVVLFRFVREDSNPNIFKGQIGITVLNRNGENQIDRNMYSLSTNKKAFQEILLNKVHYENLTAIRSECEEFFDVSTAFTCKKKSNVSIAYKTVVTIPISDKDGYSVIGYILLTLDREYDNKQIAKVVSDINPHVTEVKESMINFQD